MTMIHVRGLRRFITGLFFYGDFMLELRNKVRIWEKKSEVWRCASLCGRRMREVHTVQTRLGQKAFK